ncbi:MAG: fibronectin type III domain-containing protein, partial [Eubacterium sp.]
MEENLYTIVTRRRDEDADKEFIDTGEYNLENYLIIAPDGKCYKLDGDNENNYFLSDGFTFYSTGYYYKCEFYDFARGVEYTCEDRFIRDAGTYEFDIVTIQNNVVYKKYVEISQLDMGDWANYDMDLTQYTESAYFSGSEIAISAEIYDNSKAKLTAGKDYELSCYLNSDASKACITPHDPGDYTIRITYLGNYSGYIEVPFSVLKTDLSKLILPDSCSVTYSADIAKSCASLKIGDTTILSGTDYRVDVVGGLNYGDTGSVIITGLADSKYVQEGSVAQWTYVVDKQYDISSLFNNAYITNAKYLYTGSEIKPTDFTLSYIKSSTGQTIKLVRGTDYVIASYSDNINAGTGKVIINFIGNYTGTATMKFYIEYGQVTITCADLTYNGKSQTANPVVKVGSAVLKKGTDYTVSGSATNPGLYTGKIAGKGNFSALSGTFVYYIKPATLSGVKTTTATNSITVSWTKQGSNCIYEVWVYDTGINGWKLVCSTSGSSYKITAVYVNGKKTAVKANTQYKIRVRAVIKGTVNGTAVVKYGAVKEITERTNPAALSGVKHSSTVNSV